MSSITTANPTELSTSPQDLDNSDIINSDNDSELILENNSTDVTITKFEAAPIAPAPATTTSSITMKTQVLPFVYIQTPTKVPFSTLNKPNNSNVIVNNVQQFQFAALDTNVVSKNAQNVPLPSVSVPTNQSVIFTPMNNFGKSQQLVLQKPSGNVVPIVPVSVASGPKIGTYLTMLKPVGKSADHITTKLQLPSSVTKENISLISSGLLQTTNSAHKYVIAPMPKVTSNRLPTTVTTNSVKPKIAFMPLTMPKHELSSKQKFFNFKISDGQMESESMTDGMGGPNNGQRHLLCDEIIDLDSPEKMEIDNKSYELSIIEETSSNSDLNFDRDTTVKLTKPERKVVHKDPPKFSKHGVSILKKNYSFERKLEKSNVIICNLPNNKTSVSDRVIADGGAVVAKPEETIILAGPKVATHKPERRRKSHFCYRKDYDDMEIEATCDSKNVSNVDKFSKELASKKLVEEPQERRNDQINVNTIKKSNNNNNDINSMQDDCDLQKILKWDGGIGTLPGSKLKFIINEFNMVEYVTQEEYIKIVEKKITKTKEKSSTKDSFQEEMRCLECGCYGLPSEFISPKYCSFDCQDAGNNKCPREKEIGKFKKKRKRPLQKKAESSIDAIKPENSGSEEDNTSNENSQDKFLYPWACKKKGFSWAKYLDHIKAKSAPVKLFKDPFPYTRNGFRNGMKLEGVDPQHPSCFCVLSVSEVIGYRIRLHFDGYPDNYDFWSNADSMDIFPMGWCEKYGHVLQPPPGYTVENFNWLQYLKQTKSTAAPKHLFANRSGNAICPNGFRVGMKLEAVDRKNTALVCVASVRDMMDNRLLVHFDSWDDIYDYWADPTSPYIHPIGWCDQYGHNLTPPNDYPHPETFTWTQYLKETKSVTAPVRAFKQRPVCGFKRGMRLECVDKRVPQLIRVATVDDVKEHQIRIHFDGWPDRYSYWVDDDNPDIHPVGWCQKTGHPIEPPLTPDDVYDFLECPTVGCRGQGHIRGPKYARHSLAKYCPYAEDNIDAEKVLPDRLLSPDRTLDAVVPISREPKEKISKSKIGRPPKSTKVESIKVEVIEDVLCDKKEEKESIDPIINHNKRIKLEHQDSVEEKAITFIEDAKVLPAERESWSRHSNFLKRYVHVESDPRTWNRMEVGEFLGGLPSCGKHVDMFMDEEIDGEALLSLSQKDLLTIMNMKVGPAIKLYNSILLLRQHVIEQLFT